MKIDKNLVVAGVLMLLVLVSVVQAVQLWEMKSNISEIETTGNTVQKTTPSNFKTLTNGGSSGGIPTNLQNLPGMVGGC